MENKSYACELSTKDLAVLKGAVDGFSSHFQEFMVAKMKDSAEDENRSEIEEFLDDSFLEISAAKMKIDEMFNQALRDVMIEKLKNGTIQVSFDSECGHEECE
jgi:hypothetical protein